MEYAPEHRLASKVQYRPIDAAIRWADLLQHEQQILGAYQQRSLSAIAENAYCPQLMLYLERILDALRYGELVYLVNGQPAAPDTSVDDAAVTIRHVHLKAWMEHYYPEERPAFLFSAVERRPAVTLKDVQALLDERDSWKPSVSSRDIEMLALRLGKLLSERGDAMTRPTVITDPLSKRGEMVYQHIIGGMLDLLLGRDTSGRSNSRFRTQEDVIAALTERFGERLGMTRSTLENKFASANRTLLGRQ
jgi:hypothetical protein